MKHALIGFLTLASFSLFAQSTPMTDASDSAPDSSAKPATKTNEEKSINDPQVQKMEESSSPGSIPIGTPIPPTPNPEDNPNTSIPHNSYPTP
jgi:hypothetical protein